MFGMAGLRSGGALLVLSTSLGCSGDLPPHGEAVVVVDTNLPTPRLINRLRIDLYQPDSSWFESRDIAMMDARDWPVSFSVVAPHASASDVLLRLRGYPDGLVRPYVGERFREPTEYEPPFVPEDMAEACARAPGLVLGSAVTVRRGYWPFPPRWQGECAGQTITTGTTAVRVEIPKRGSYRFGAVALGPRSPPPQYALPDPHAVLQLRTTCGDPTSSIGCSIGLDDQGNRVLPELQVDDLAEGTYYLVTAGWFEAQAADITLAAAPTSEWSLVEVPPESTPEPEPRPRWLNGDPEQTPAEEPQPESAVDRLVAIRLKEGEVQRVNVVLDTACAGTMADLADGLASARSCIAQEGVLEDVDTVSGSGSGTASPSPIGPFLDGKPCPLEAPSSDPVCVPGGISLLGLREAAGLDDRSSVPERLAVLERFYIDRFEVTVERYRTALAAGFTPKPAWEAPVAASAARDCTWTEQPGTLESRPLNCISWYGARAFCRFLGGDLPTEAQWEYVAQTIGRRTDTPYPWGSSPPRCNCNTIPDPCHAIALGLETFAGDPGPCPNPTVSVPVPVDAHLGQHGDVSLGLGVSGLGGNVREWVLDASRGYDHPCWEGSRLAARTCQEPHAPSRVTRGGSYAGLVSMAASKASGLAGTGAPVIGFRCVYSTAQGASP